MNSTDIHTIAGWLGTGSINIFGLPFSGKDTHGTKLAELFDAALISGGDILRNSPSSTDIKNHIAQGNLAPTDQYLAVVLPYLSGPNFAGRPLILSSVGRWHGEEDSVMEAAAASGHPIKAVIYLSITSSEAMKRWQLAERGREDDAAEDILLRRFDEFEQKTLPVIEYYRQKGLLIEVDGLPPIEKVTDDMLSKLAAIIPQK
jgi:adenylate kinase